jgi:hemerythrin
MDYKWDDSLASGYEPVDKQHIQLFTILERLIDASCQGRGDEIIFNVLEYLTAYSITHFKTEEDLMVKYEYKDYAAHKKLHDTFKIKVTALNKQVTETGPTPDMINLVATTIGDWLLHHIKFVDHIMAEFVKAKDKT